MSRTGADRLLADTVRVDGKPVDRDATYKVALNEFLANGGNGFTVFGEITTRQGGDVTELEALVDHLKTTTADNPAIPPAPGRITSVTH
ncbi:5'-nucleotidase C-terminal domain-containing protein [Streptomyces sp. NPDC088183]|uniref:5'-nucleotidase C-terminal domain-containing protein n=1 Tax=Streptomyces sp. NPDC088183 TaxID=3160992 RepID=UPI0034495D17